ncbi:MAG: acyl-CoA thioesterase [Chitinophagales bacterium]|nr:acyl-CoA thioesterase [Chitinophagales bacterium]
MKKNIPLDEILKPFRFKKRVETRWSDMDEMHHINNAIYLTYFEQARVYYFHEACEWDWKNDGAILAAASIEYIAPLRFPEAAYIYVRTKRIGQKSLDMDYVIVRENEDSSRTLITLGNTIMVTYDYFAQKSIPVPDYIRQRIISYEPYLNE